jgi:hypothetical protein
MLSTSANQIAIAYLRSPQAIRERCQQLFDLAIKDNKLKYFRCHLERLDATVNYVFQNTQKNYPDFDIPFHSRWRHFEVGGVPRLAELDSLLTSHSALEKAQAKFDLAIISVLLDAGAGSKWRYRELETDQIYQRSEGLAIASFYWFCQGGFSSNPQNPLQADAIALQRLTQSDLEKGFQVTSDNPLVGIAGRTNLLQHLGQTLEHNPHLFGSSNPRPGHLVNHLLKQTVNNQLAAQTVLEAVLEGLGEIWPGRTTLSGVNLGDIWRHSSLPPLAALPQPPLSHLIPFHKLSQWLTYSLLEPLQELGLEIVGLDALTGLPEYRNGGLCLDLGLLQVQDPLILQQAHSPASEVIVEWRALTVILLDRIAEAMRFKLGMDATQLPLVKVLQGGTWAAGRAIAAELRSGGVPPLQIESDGTVF